MFGQAFNFVSTAVSYVLNLFASLADHLGFGGLLLTLFTIYTISRLLLTPLLGAASSDFASQAISSAKSSSDKAVVAGQKALPSGKKSGSKK